MNSYTDPYAEPKRFDAVQASLTVTLFVLLGVTVFLGFGMHGRSKDLADAKVALASLQEELDRTKEQAEKDLRNATAAHQAEVQRLNAEWQGQLQAQRQEGEKRLQEGMAEVAKVIDEVVNNSGATVGYLQQLEAKVRKGQTLQAGEIDKLRALAGGLTYLSEQYEKPIGEFKELQTYLSRQLELPASVTPEEQGRFLRRLFSRDFREQQKTQLAEYYQDQGRRDAVVAMQARVEESYGRAQKEMAAIRQEQKNYLASLEALVQAKEGDVQDMNEFFAVSSRILAIHKRMLALEAPALPDAAQPPVPVNP
jgi:hypothetical protein